jgi:hypothetical protein
VLVSGTREEGKQSIAWIVSLFDGLGGGYVGATSHTIMPETPLDNIIAMYEAFLETQRR